MSTRVLFVHGINTPAHYKLEEYVAARLAEVSIQTKVEAVRWNSTGTASKDIMKTALNRRWRRSQVMSVGIGIADFAQRVKAMKDRGLIIAHSMGSVWTPLAERVRRTGLPIIFIGSPLNHPIWKHWLGINGLRNPQGLKNKPLNFYNPDDIVAASPFWGTRPPKWCVNTEVAVEGYTNPLDEHNAGVYLKHPDVVKAIKKTLNLA